MAKVEFFQATDMSALPSSPPSGDGIGTTAGEVDIDFSNNYRFDFIAPFDPSTNLRTITHAFIETPDDGDVPNLLISDLAFSALVDFYNQVTPNAAQFISGLLSGDDTLMGSPGTDVMLGFGGNDILNGGLGADALAGGTGDDWYFVDNPGDIIAETERPGHA